MATVLVVDDEDDIRYLVQVNLELDGHTVVMAADGAEAIDVARSRRPDLMILDLMMPRVDGWGVLETLKSEDDPAVKQIPVIMLTAHDTSDNRIRGGIEGAIRYLGKPFSPAALRAEVRSALKGDPEPVQRRAAQTRALRALARQEKGLSDPLPSPAPATSHLVAPSPVHGIAGREEPVLIRTARERLDDLTAKQRELLLTLRDTRSVTEAAVALEVSRSNIYASLRRIGRKLGTSSVPELLAVVRTGGLLDGL